MRSRRCSGASRRPPPCAHRPPGSQSCAHLGLHRLARMPCTTEARMPGCSAFASPLQPSPSGAALRSGCMRLTRSCSSRLCRTFVPLAADLRKPACRRGPRRWGAAAAAGGSKAAARRLQGGCKRDWSRAGGGPPPQRGQAWRQGRVCGCYGRSHSLRTLRAQLESLLDFKNQVVTINGLRNL